MQKWIGDESSALPSVIFRAADVTGTVCGFSSSSFFFGTKSCLGLTECNSAMVHLFANHESEQVL